MKTKLQTLLAVLSIIFSMATALAQQPQPAMPVPIDPTTGLPVSTPNIDTATGLPADGSPPFKDSKGVPTWIDPAWVDPGGMNIKVMPVNFSALPLSEVARQLQMLFENSFDIIFPTSVDPNAFTVNLQLKNVRASEIFSAMNMQFELDRSPLRWELTFNGKRPTAILRNLPQLAPPAPPAPAPLPQIRKTFFVGDMLNDYPGTNDEAKLASITTNILACTTGYGVVAPWGGKPRLLRVKVAEYPPGQLLIVSGTPDEVDFVEQTLRGLKDKAAYDKTPPQPPPVKSQ